MGNGAKRRAEQGEGNEERKGARLGAGIRVGEGKGRAQRQGQGQQQRNIMRNERCEGSIARRRDRRGEKEKERRSTDRSRTRGSKASMDMCKGRSTSGNRGRKGNR